MKKKKKKIDKNIYNITKKWTVIKEFKSYLICKYLIKIQY